MVPLLSLALPPCPMVPTLKATEKIEQKVIRYFVCMGITRILTFMLIKCNIISMKVN